MAPNLSKAAADLLGDVAVDGLKPASRFTLKGGKDLAVDGHVALLDVPANIRLTPASTVVPPTDVPEAGDGCFLGFDAPAPDCRHVVPFGRLVDTRFMSIFRFKVWWTTHWVGTAGRDVENETQMMVLDRTADRPYVLLLPIVDGAFRACLQSAGGDDDHVALCLESGSSAVLGSVFRSAVYLHAGDDPFDLVRQAARVVRAHLGTFVPLEEKTPPPIVDKFGWCTWDAFYLKVHPEGVWEGVRLLAEGGCPPGLVLIDDGWQSICHDDDDPADGAEGMNRTAAGEQMPCRLIKFEENHKFRDYKGGLGLGGFVREMKAAFPTVEQVYVWHALCGYWGGLRPGAPGLPPAKVVAPKLSPGLKRTMEDLAVDKIVNNGVGLVDPEHAGELYEGLHAHLQASGIDVVKVDVIHLQTLDQIPDLIAGALLSSNATNVSQTQGGGGQVSIDMPPPQARIVATAPAPLIAGLWGINLSTLIPATAALIRKPASDLIFGGNKIVYYPVVAVIWALGLGGAATAYCLSRPGGGNWVSFGRRVLCACILDMVAALAIYFVKV